MRTSFYQFEKGPAKTLRDSENKIVLNFQAPHSIWLFPDKMNNSSQSVKLA
jgi:hypothetical protein